MKTSRRCKRVVAGTLPIYRTEKRYLCKDGSVLWGAATITPSRDPESQLQYFLTMVEDISERRRFEDAQALQARIATIFSTVPHEEMFSEVLAVVLEVMQSPLGVFGYLDANGDWVVPTMTREVWQSCQVAEKTIRFPEETWGDGTRPCALREKRTIYSNEPSTTIPAGHLPIQRHISLPILFQGEAIGLFQVANKESDYTEEDIRTLSGIAEQVAPLLRARLKREWAEQALRQSEFNYRAVADNTYDWEWWLGSDGRYLYVSPSCERISGHRADEFLADPDLMLAITHPDDVATLKAHMKASASRVPNEHRLEFRIVRPSGEERLIEHLCQEVIAADGSLFGRRGSNRDITERRWPSEALKESEERLSLTLEATNDGLWDWNVPTGERSTAPATTRCWATNPMSSRRATPPASSSSTRTTSAPWSARSRRDEERRRLAIEMRLRTKNGDWRWILSRGKLVEVDAEGRPLRMVGTHTDITELRQAQQAAAERSHFLEELLEAIPVPVFYKDTALRYVGCNEAFAAALRPLQGRDHRQDRLRCLSGRAGAALRCLRPRAAGAPGADRRRTSSRCPAPMARRATQRDPQGRLLRRHRQAGRHRRRRPRRDRDPRAPRRLCARAPCSCRLTLKAAVAALGPTTEMRDPYTAGHQRRVAELACAIAAELGWDEATHRDAAHRRPAARHRQDRRAGRDPH